LLEGPSTNSCFAAPNHRQDDLVPGRGLGGNRPIVTQRSTVATRIEPCRLAGLNAGTSPGAVGARFVGSVSPSSVSVYYDLDAGAPRRSYDRHIAPALAAWPCRRHTVAPLSELATDLGLLRGDSVPSLLRRFRGRLKNSPWLKRDMEEIERRLTARMSAPGALVGKGRNLECIVGR